MVHEEIIIGQLTIEGFSHFIVLATIMSLIFFSFVNNL